MKHTNTDRGTRRRAETPKFLFPVIDKILMPSTHRRPEKTQTKTGDRTPDLTRPTDPTRHTSTDRKRTYLAVGRLSGPFELAGASQFWPCAGLEGGRDGSPVVAKPHFRWAGSATSHPRIPVCFRGLLRIRTAHQFSVESRLSRGLAHAPAPDEPPWLRARLNERKQAATTVQFLSRTPRNITVPVGTSRRSETQTEQQGQITRADPPHLRC
jgi:hypothetical protein